MCADEYIFLCTIVFDFWLVLLALDAEGSMPRPKPHYRLLVLNLQTQERLRLN